MCLKKGEKKKIQFQSCWTASQDVLPMATLTRPQGGTVAGGEKLQRSQYFSADEGEIPHLS